VGRSLLDDRLIKIAGSDKKTKDHLEQIFKTTFDVISKAGGEEIFRRWDSTKNEFAGSFLISAFEIFGLGIGYHVATGTKYRTDLLAVTKALWQRPNAKGLCYRALD
jgi:hypothetical protein